MSKVSLAGNASGTGIFTIASPNSNTDRTLTLPDNTGTLLTGASAIQRSQMYAGALLQVVQTAYSTVDSTSSSAQTATGCTASITPSSASNKILAVLNMPTWHGASGQNGAGQISRNSGAALSGLVQDFYSPTGSGVTGNINVFWLDSPATTSAVTYTATFGTNNSGGTLSINKDYNSTNNGVTYLTLMEIAA